MGRRMPQREASDGAGRLATVAPILPRTVEAPAQALDLSVCIVNWNCSDVVRDCLHSLRQQSLGLHYEIIVVDNASADGAPDMIARDFPEVRLLRNATNTGFARANNQAARL